MMGSKGGKTAREIDAFSRFSRRVIHWQRGELAKLKRAFHKRARRAAIEQSESGRCCDT